MQEFLIYFNMGLKHVLDITAYDHIVFLIALLIPYTFKDWKRVFLLVSLFTLGHTFALVLSVFGVVSISIIVVEFLIPITILITALYHLFTAGKSAKKETVSFVAIVTVCFGLIHGLGFSNYFNTIMVGSGMNKLVPLLEFALGIEAAQLIVVLAVLLLAYILQTFFRFSKRDWALVLSGCIIGVVLPMILQSEIFK
jgi:hypothetical protein